VPHGQSLALTIALSAGVMCCAVPVSGQLPFGEQRYEYELGDVLPGAAEFVRSETHWRAYGTAEQGGEPPLLGYVFLTDDLVEIPGYSGETMNTLVGLDTQGAITGIRIVRHSEPIVLIGLSEAAIHEFIDQYLGKNIIERIIIGTSDRPGYTSVDGISGATVTAIAENATVLEAGRLVGRAEGFVQASQVRKQRPADWFEALTWKELAARQAIGSITVQSGELGQQDELPAVSLRFAILDPPAIGKNLVGEHFYGVVRERLDRDGGSAIYVGGDGELSFKGAGFARGGIFDRFLLEQAGDLFVFKDVDFINLPKLLAEGAPAFREGGIFFVDEEFDPTQPFTFRLTVPYRIADERAYATYLADYRLPGSFVDSETPFWATRWRVSAVAVIFLSLLISATALAFALRQRLLRHRKLIHLSIATLSALVVGLVLKAQPSTTQILTLAGSAARLRFPSEIFLSEPLIFIFWITIVLSLFVWGRGFFCGWLCPYGALLEVLISLWQRLAPESLRRRIEAWEPPLAWRYGKYVTFLVIFGVAFVSLPLAEALDEVEPFKTYVLRLARPTAFVVYFILITLISVVSHRFFCRFLCPLGGALSIPSGRPPLRLKRYDMCTDCKICGRGCEPRAISFETGAIDYRECLQCWDCQNTGEDRSICPALIVAAKENRLPRLMAGVIVLALLGWSSSSAAKTWKVDPELGSLGAVLSQSADGDTIVVQPGLYRENVVVEKRLSIRGIDGAIIDAGGNGNVLVIASPDVTIEGLTLRGCGNDRESSHAGIWVEQSASEVKLIQNHIEDCKFGIWVHGSENAQVTGNRIEGLEDLRQDARGDCIHLWNVRGASITDNVVADCRDGIYMELSHDSSVVGNEILRSRYSVHTMWCDRSVYNENFAQENLVGLALMFSTGIEARRNTLVNNATHGLLLVQVTRGSAVGNWIIGNAKGIFVYNSLYNTLRGNLVARNTLGMHYWGGSEDNEIAENTFIENQIQVKFVAARDQSWQGNFWSDYGGWDVDADGRGEVPYRSNTLVDSLLWKYPVAKLLLTSPAFQLLALAEREFPVIGVPKVIDGSPWMAPPIADWAAILDRYPAHPGDYFGEPRKLPHLPGEHH